MKQLLALSALFAAVAQAQTVTISPAAPTLDTTPNVYRGSTLIQSNAATLQACIDRIRADALTRASGTYTYSCRPNLTAITATVVAAPPPPPPPPPMTDLTVVNVSLIPAPAAGSSTVNIRNTGQMGYPDPDGTGAFRMLCGYSHFNFDDPVVFPGLKGASHLHIYFGNTAVDYTTTPANLNTKGNGTCNGGTANRSAYWLPAIIDTREGRPMVPRIVDVYYKTGYQGNTNASIRPMPPGLRMVAGDSKATIEQWINGQQFFTFTCNSGGGTATIPNCPVGGDFQMHITFPQCWDGVNLDSPDHKSHMAHGRWGVGCPASHPVPIPEISVIARYTSNGSSTWRLSSDRNGFPAGLSAHGDWMNGWGGPHVEYLPSVFVTRLLNAGLSGGSFMLGDGRVLE